MLTSLSLAVVSVRTGSIIKKTAPVKEKGALPPAQGGGVQPLQQQALKSPPSRQNNERLVFALVILGVWLLLQLVVFPRLGN